MNSLFLLLSVLAFAHDDHTHHGNGQNNNVGDAEIFASLPSDMAWPEGVVADYHRKVVYVTRPAAFGTAGAPASSVLVYDFEGNEIATLTVTGEDLSQEHALVEGALGYDGDLFVNSTQLGVLRFTRNDTHTLVWAQEQYSVGPFPVLIPFLPSIPNGMAFGPDGELYVADSLQNVMWKVPPGGGLPSMFFADPSLTVLNGARMGMNGVKLDPSREHLYFSFSGGVTEPGRIYSLPISEPTSANLRLVYTYELNDIPDGMAFDKDSNLYVVLAGANAISVLSDIDTAPFESDRIVGPNNVNVPFTQPSTISLDPHGRWAFVVNHALDTAPPGAPVPDPSPFVVYDLYVGARGDSLP